MSVPQHKEPIIDVLEEHEDGLTTREIADEIGEDQLAVRNDLVRLRIHDGEVEKTERQSIDQNRRWVLTDE